MTTVVEHWAVMQDVPSKEKNWQSVTESQKIWPDLTESQRLCMSDLSEAMNAIRSIPGSPTVRERRQELLKLFMSSPRLTVSTAATLMKTAPVTIRQDMSVLEQLGLIKSVRDPKGVRKPYFVRLA